MIKAVVCLEHDIIPPNIKFDKPNPKSEFAAECGTAGIVISGSICCFTKFTADSSFPGKEPQDPTEAYETSNGEDEAHQCEFIWCWRIKRPREYLSCAHTNRDLSTPG